MGELPFWGALHLNAILTATLARIPLNEKLNRALDSDSDTLNRHTLPVHHARGVNLRVLGASTMVNINILTI